MQLTETIYRFCTRDMHSFYLQNRQAYDWILKHWVEKTLENEQITTNTFIAVFTYLQKRQACPASIDAMIQYIRLNPDKCPEFEKSRIAEEELRKLKDFDADEALDDNVLFASLLDEARTRKLTHICQMTANIAIGGAFANSKTKEGTGPSEAIKWFRTAVTYDFSPEAPVVAGILADNVPALLTDLENTLRPSEMSGKFQLGLQHIDECVTVGRQNLRFIGVLGMSGDGKTTLTNHIVYNWLTQGAHILYVSTEHSPTEIWKFMAFLHQSHIDYDFTLPPAGDWENGTSSGKVTGVDEFHMNKILCDIQARKNLPGLLDVQQFRDWDAIKDYLMVNAGKNKYDILVVDYLSRLDVPGDQKFRDKAIGAMVHDTFGLSRAFDENRGLIVLTPIQVNREGHKKALKAEEGESRYDINAVSQVSEYQHDLDLLLSVWSDDSMKMDDECEIQCLKKRKGKQPPPQRMIISPNSGEFIYKVATSVVSGWDRTVEDVIYTPTTTTDLSKDWGL